MALLRVIFYLVYYFCGMSLQASKSTYFATFKSLGTLFLFIAINVLIFVSQVNAKNKDASLEALNKKVNYGILIDFY